MSKPLATNKWLSERLSPARQESSVWVELFEAIEEWADTSIFPEVERLKDARKAFGSDDTALNYLISEMGDFFEVPEIDGNTREVQRHVDLLWRRHELHKKRLTVAFDSYLNRVLNLHGLSASWEPLYWKSGEDYANCDLYPNIGILSDYCDHLSSRGAVYVDIDRSEIPSNDWLFEKLKLANQRARKVVPAHIVVDGNILRRGLNGCTLKAVGQLRKGWMIGYATNEGDFNISRVDGEVRSKTISAVSNPKKVIHATNKADSNTARVNSSHDSRSFGGSGKPIHIAYGAGTTNT